jgi:hypothetical protein
MVKLWVGNLRSEDEFVQSHSEAEREECHAEGLSCAPCCRKIPPEQVSRVMKQGGAGLAPFVVGSHPLTKI